MTSNTRRAGGFPWAAVACALAGAAVFQFYGNATLSYIKSPSLFYWWFFQWSNPRSETEHGWLILAISAWLLWRNLKIAERRLPIADCQAPQLAIGNWQSAIAMLAGLALHAVGFAGQQSRISIVALLVFTWGVLRLAGGRRWGAAAMFPLGFLIFAIPLNALDSAGFWLRLWVIDASGWLAHAAGIGVLQSGTQLVAPDGRYNYDVAAACSGVRSLMALAALSLLAGYLNFRSWWRRGVALLLCFPLVYLGNVARVTAIIFAAQWAGPAWGERVHEWFGFLVFVIVLGGVLAAMEAMRRWWPETTASTTALPLSARGADVCHLMDDKRVWAVGGTIVALTVGEMFFLHHLATMPPRGGVGVVLAADEKNPVELPAFLGTDWIGRRAEVTAVERELLPEDTGFARKIYVSVAKAQQQVFLSVVLSGRDRTSIHRPELCLVGQGWSIASSAEHRFVFPGRSEAAFTAKLLRVRREVATPRGTESVPQLVAYWFVGGDAVVSSHWERLVLDGWNRVIHARADRWAYVLMQTDARDGEPAALARMQAVLSETLPVFQRPLRER